MEDSLLKERFTGYAREYLARDPNDTSFPQALWEKMVRQGLFDLGAKERLAGNYLTLGLAGEVFAGAGGSLGMALSWLMHELIAMYFMMGFGNPRQQQYSACLTAGKGTIAFAVSEPEKGAHPKYLQTTAVREGERYCLNGRKAYVTNGPLAAMFIVVAITGEEAGRKRFTAFLVPADAPGLTVTPMEMPFLRPAPHAVLRLENCMVSAEDILGREDEAYADMVLPFREVEDALMMGPLVGAMARQLHLLGACLRESGREVDAAEALGHLQAIVHVERLLAHETQRMLDRDLRGPEYVSQLIVFRGLARDFLGRSQALVPDEKAGQALADLRNDFRLSMSVAENVLRIKQRKMGEAIG